MRVCWPGVRPQAAGVPDVLRTYIDSRKARTKGAVPSNA